MRQMPSLNMLRVFEEVARNRSFSQSALGLNVTQGAVKWLTQSIDSTCINSPDPG
ncbi:hypothetical protein SAMN04490187_3164 [Pseudomonas jessenii]|jgi:glucose dehydrogenase|uniref:HTH lysR-type domain-containing protein n=1 Tax=Pseudomonas jessenii TaxID=77298 RepID=A0A1H4PR93_PSEJE|nr:hypothetical protein SAMN04490187_3164 [Pseudomonas jessenii]